MRWLLLLLIIPCAFSIGISPASTNLNFQPWSREVITLAIHNEPSEPFEAQVYLTGDLKEFMELSEDRLSFKEGESVKEVELAITMPGKVSRPGTHLAEVKVREVASRDDDGALDIKPSLGVVSRIKIHVPYPGKYATAKLKTQDIAPGERIPFYISVFNLGEEDIGEAYARIRIYDPRNKRMDEIMTDGVPIPAQSSAELKSQVPSEGYLVGNYNVSAVVYYDDKLVPLEGLFTIDGFFLELVLIDFGDFELGEVARLKFALENRGNRKVEEAFVRVQVLDSKGRIVEALESIPIAIPMQGQEETLAYWDTSGISSGKYRLEIFMHYDDRVEQEDVTVYVGEQGISFSKLTGMAAAEGGELERSLAIITVLLVTIAILLMIWKYWKRH